MRFACLLVVAACSTTSGTSARTCPTSPNQPLPQCDEMNQNMFCTYPARLDGGSHRDTHCVCQGEFWVCNSCPSDSFPPNGGACTPGDTCEWNTWEHGCDCACGSAGIWSCAPLTIGTVECGSRDAGV